MASKYAFDSIDRTTFEEILKEYPDVVPDKLAALEAQRLRTIPAALVKRRSEGKPYLTKDEAVSLVDWKLSHGTFRPSLKKLVQSNSEEVIEEATGAAFSSDENVEARLNMLVTLKGIGPATASLLLSTLNPQEIPFFSDELFLWALWENKTGNRWDRKIKYSAKEYRELLAKVNQLRERLGASALDAEKVAYVLGKREIDLGCQSQEESVAEAEPEQFELKRRSSPDDTAPREELPAPKKQKVAPRSKAPAEEPRTSLRRSGRNKNTS